MTALLETVEHETGPQPQWSVLWLHGQGADGHDLRRSCRNWCAGTAGDPLRVPHAPVRAVTINGGARMRAWVRHPRHEPGHRADGEGDGESVAQVEA